MKNKFGHFLVVVQLIHRRTEADINSTTTVRLFFFPLLVLDTLALKIVDIDLDARNSASLLKLFKNDLLRLTLKKGLIRARIEQGISSAGEPGLG